jgi:hypothetical protein
LAETKYNKKDINSVQSLDKSFSDGYAYLMRKSGVSSDHYHDLVNIGHNVDDIISKELNNPKSITTDEMSTFLVKTFNSQDNISGVSGINTIDDIFKTNESGLESFFQERYQNQNLLYDDLNMICAQLAELDAAVTTTRDAIVTADDISKTISRKITFENTLSNDSNINNYIGVIEEIEKNLKLPKKIKNQVITHTLKFGRYYAYVIPYEKLFEQQYAYKVRDGQIDSGNSLKESLTEASCVSITDMVNEDAGYISTFKQQLKNEFSINQTDAVIKEAMKEYTDGITVTNDIYSIPLIEGVDVTHILSDDEFKKRADEAIKKSDKVSKSYSDGVIDTDKHVKGKFKNINGCYIKFIDPRKVIPVKVLDTIIGYYYIHDTELRRDRAPFSSTVRVTNSISTATAMYDSDGLESTFIQGLADKIVKAFNPKYVENNQKFKDLIVNALVYSDLSKKNINFQFIPSEYMVEFTINEDENGDGQSVLKQSLFYAKLYLALLIFKLISIMTRSNDTRIYYIKNGGIDTNITNKIQDVARSIKAKQINFMDLLNYNSIISKVGSFKDVYMPVGRSGERGIEFDTLAGQQVDLDSPLMEFLRNNMINSTHVPTVIMEYINAADYAKGIQTGQTRFANWVINLQLDFNPSLTELYQKIVRYSGAPIPEEFIDKLVYTLDPASALNVQNNTDNINLADQLIMSIIKSKIGENDNSDSANIVRDIMYKELSRTYIPNINWAWVDDIHKRAVLEANNRLIENEES